MAQQPGGGMTQLGSGIEILNPDPYSVGSRSAGWWTTRGSIAIEGVTLLICAISYCWLQYFHSGSPLDQPVPALGAATIQSVLMAASWYPMSRLNRAAGRFDREQTRSLLTVLSLFGIACLAVRWFEFRAVNVDWDAGIYGAIVWATLGLHTLLLALEVTENICFAVLFSGRNATERHYTEVTDNTVCWCFMTGSWILLAALLFLRPRLG
jgi:heme/copper-type cytochrome/quinol oxidase subunit 3